MSGLYAADPGRTKPRNGDPRPSCANCSTTARRCDTTRWLRAAACCANCDHGETRPNPNGVTR